ncbi:unnamed protein product, partial [Ectocarpus fasciculatus]
AVPPFRCHTLHVAPPPERQSKPLPVSPPLTRSHPLLLSSFSRSILSLRGLARPHPPSLNVKTPKSTHFRFPSAISWLRCPPPSIGTDCMQGSPTLCLFPTNYSLHARTLVHRYSVFPSPP